MKKNPYLFIIIILLISGCARNNAINPGQEIRLYSKILNEERSISIYLPENYTGTDDSYPVLYLLDGETHYLHGCGAVSYLGDNGYVPEMILVSLTNVDRNRDFSPVHVDNIPTSGGAPAFLSFISDELIPYINKNYQTSGYDILVGHSFGGVFAVYSLLEKPALFDAYIAVSPFLQFAGEHMVKETEKKLEQVDRPVCFFMTIGQEPAYFEALDKFSLCIKNKNDPNFDFEYKAFETEDHMSNPYPSLYYGLRYIFRDWQISDEVITEGLEAIDDYYKSLSSKYGIDAVPPENILNNLGYAYLQNQDIENAITVFKANVNYHPDSPNVYDSLGEAYENNGQRDLAGEHYKKAYDMGVKLNHPLKEIFKANYERVTGNP